MSQHLNMYSQKGCIGCKPCEGGGAHIGRLAVLWGTFGLFCFGLFLPFFKKCQYCGHNTWWNKHLGPDRRTA